MRTPRVAALVLALVSLTTVACGPRVIVRSPAPSGPILGGSPGRPAEEERKSFIGLTVGPAIPFGTFADKSTTNARAGRAMLGYSDSFVNFGRRFGQRWGIAASAWYDEHNIQDLENDDWWQVAGLTLGPMYSYAITRNAVIDMKAKVGPVATARIIDSYLDMRGRGFGADLRGSLRYNVHRRWALLAEAGVMAANQVFPDGSKTGFRALITGFGAAYRPAW